MKWIPNPHTLHINCASLEGKDDEKQIMIISSMLSNQVKHFKVYVSNFSLMKFILKEFVHLSSVVIESSRYFSNQYDEIIN